MRQEGFCAHVGHPFLTAESLQHVPWCSEFIDHHFRLFHWSGVSLPLLRMKASPKAISYTYMLNCRCLTMLNYILDNASCDICMSNQLCSLHDWGILFNSQHWCIVYVLSVRLKILHACFAIEADSPKGIMAFLHFLNLLNCFQQRNKNAACPFFTRNVKHAGDWSGCKIRNA